MKFVVVIILTVFIGMQAKANGGLVSCVTSDQDNLTSRLRIFQSRDGYSYEFSSCEGSYPVECTPYKSDGKITRVMGEITIGNDFLSRLYHTSSGGFGHLFGFYTFSDGKGPAIEFPDETCRFSDGEKTDIVTRGQVGEGAFGSCSQPQPIGYVGLAKQRAEASASSLCTPLKARRISEFDIFPECLNNFTTAVVRATYRCE